MTTQPTLDAIDRRILTALQRSGRISNAELSERVALSPSVAALGFFQTDDVNLSEVAANVPAAQRIFNEVGWE